MEKIKSEAKSIFCKPPESEEVESVKENWVSYNGFMNKHRSRMKELLPSLKGKLQDGTLEESLSASEPKWYALSWVEKRGVLEHIL